MTDQQIALFRCVVRCGSFSKAARELGVAQSTISREIAQLEDEMQAPLFFRMSNGVSPTPAGEYLSYSSFRDLVGKITEDCRRVAGGQMPGLLMAVGTPTSLLIQPVLDKLVAMKLDMPLRMHTVKSYDILRMLLSGDANAGFLLAQDAKKEPCLTTLPLCSPRWLVAAREDHEYWSLSPADRAVLRRQVVIINAESLNGTEGDAMDCVSRYCVDQGLPFRRFLRANFQQDLAVMLGAGLGVALVPPFVAPDLPPNIRLSDELSVPFAPEFVMACRAGSKHPGVRILWDLCREHFGGGGHE